MYLSYVLPAIDTVQWAFLSSIVSNTESLIFSTQEEVCSADSVFFGKVIRRPMFGHKTVCNMYFLCIFKKFFFLFLMKFVFLH